MKSKADHQPVTSISKEVCKLLSVEIMEALQSVAERYDLTLDRKSGRYDNSSFTLPVVFSIQELRDDKAEQEFAMFAPAYGVDPSVGRS